MVIKIKSPTLAEFEAWRALTNYAPTDRGMEQTGREFHGDLTVAVVGNAYALELICRVLRSACIAFSLETGRPVAKRKRKCGTSTQSSLQMVALMSEVQSDPTSDCESTTTESAKPPEASNGEECSA